MNDDIVARLSDEAFKAKHSGLITARNVMYDAIYEIETLQHEVERLQQQVDIAHSILASEMVGWIVMGTEHYELYWEGLRKPITQYWKKYGSYFKEASRG